MDDIVGQITTPTFSFRAEGIRVAVAQYQPTERPIEDRFSVNYDASQNRLIVGVYDGACLDVRDIRPMSCPIFIHGV